MNSLKSSYRLYYFSKLCYFLLSCAAACYFSGMLKKHVDEDWITSLIMGGLGFAQTLGSGKPASSFITESLDEYRQASRCYPAFYMATAFTHGVAEICLKLTSILPVVAASFSISLSAGFISILGVLLGIAVRSMEIIKTIVIDRPGPYDRLLSVFRGVSGTVFFLIFANGFFKVIQTALKIVKILIYGLEFDEVTLLNELILAAMDSLLLINHIMGQYGY